MAAIEGDAAPIASAEVSPPRSRSEPVTRASELYRRFYARCFWQCPRDLEITEDLIPFVVKGLRMHGGRERFRLAGKLQPTAAARVECEECRCPPSRERSPVSGEGMTHE